MELSNVSIGKSVIIKSIDVDPKTLRILNNIGLTKGVAVKIIRYAPFGDPLEISIRGFYLAIRKDIARKIRVEKG